MRSVKIQNLAFRLDQITESNVWEPEDNIFDHNYHKLSVKDCVTNYICGYLSRKLTNNTKCI